MKSTGLITKYELASGRFGADIIDAFKSDVNFFFSFVVYPVMKLRSREGKPHA
jgi:hypothetical protein